MGFKIPRQGEHYITVLDPETNDRYRLKGSIYEKSWQVGKNTKSKIQPAKKSKKKELFKIQKRIEELAYKRAEYNIDCYDNGGELPNLETVLNLTKTEVDFRKKRKLLYESESTKKKTKNRGLSL